MRKNIERYERQIAAADEVRAARQADPRRIAQREAVRLLPHIQQIGLYMSNIGNVAESALAESALNGNPIQFVHFWGVGEKQKPDSLDYKYIQRLGEMRNGLAQAYNPGARITFILADLHGQFNGFLREGEKGSYLPQIKDLLLSEGFHTRWISELYEKYGLNLPNSHESINKSPFDEPWIVFNKQREQYEASAGKHHANPVEKEAAAYWYVVMRLQERRMLREEFPASFVMVNGKKLTGQPLMPEGVPVIYLREGPVWFKEGEPV